jgi:DNA-binding XRE family transcriptional regulator
MSVRSRPEQAIAARQLTRDRNRERIAWAIAELRASGHQISKSAVATLAKVSRGTVYSHPDLLGEIETAQTEHRATPASAAPKRGGQAEARKTSETQALLNQIRAENKQLRQRVTAAERAAHQAIGTAGSLADPDDLAEARAENVRLATQLANTSEHIRELRQQLSETQEDLVAAKQLNIEYFQALNLERSNRQTTRSSTVTPA